MLKLTEKIVGGWYEEYKAGSTLPRLSLKFKVSTGTIRTHFKKYGFQTRTISEGAKIGRRLLSDRARAQVEKTQFKKGSVPHNYKHIPKEELERLYNAGLSSLQIAKKLNLSKTIVLRKLKKYNIPISKATKERGKIKKGQAPWNKNKTEVYSIETIDKIRKARLKQIFPKKDTLPERLFEKGLKRNKIKYHKHPSFYPICQPDFFIEPKTVIFIDGDYWHVNPHYMAQKDQKTLTEAQRKNLKRDIMQNKILKEQGFRVLRFWESDIKKDLEICLNILKKGE